MATHQRRSKTFNNKNNKWRLLTQRLELPLTSVVITDILIPLNGRIVSLGFDYIDNKPT